MILLGRKTNFKQADGSSIHIVNHQDAHTMYDVTIYEWQQSLGTCSGTWVLGYTAVKNYTSSQSGRTMIAPILGRQAASFTA